MSQIGMFDRPPAPDAAAAGPPVLSVSEALQRANRALEERVREVWVEGELSNLHAAGSGHAFFTLKDERAALPVAMWRSSVQRLRFRLESGQRLRVFGRMGVYPAQGKFQLYAERAEPAGLGELMLQLEQLKARLAAEGLFAAARKRALPRWPRVIGVVTSREGAAIHDILQVVRRRCPSRVLIAPAAVQGDGAPAQLRAALVRLEQVHEVDVIIIGRGGGSLEDLWAFNNEGLARVIASCRVPVISAVGHEVDFTVADMVADVRAATPSQAGELVVPDLRAIVHDLGAMEQRIRSATSRRLLDERRRLDELRRRVERVGRLLLAGQRQRLAALERRLAVRHPRAQIAGDRRRLDQAWQVLGRDARRLVTRARVRLGHCAGKLDALSPLAVLERGYAVVTDAHDAVVTDAATLAAGDELRVQLFRGRVRATVRGREDDE